MADAAIVEEVEEQEVAPQWERAECTCPDWCERDHERDDPRPRGVRDGRRALACRGRGLEAGQHAEEQVRGELERREEGGIGRARHLQDDRREEPAPDLEGRDARALRARANLNALRTGDTHPRLLRLSA